MDLVKKGVIIISSIILLGATVVSQLTVALTNNDLAATPASPNLFVPIVRFGVAAVGDVPPQWFWRQNGTCVSNSMANDIGHCVNGSDGNSFVALTSPSGMDVRQWGAKGDGATDDTTAIQACLTAQ